MTTDHDTTEMDRAMAALGVREDLLSDAERQHLDEQGYLVMPGVVDGNWLSALRERFEALCEAEGERAGVEVHQEAGTRRLSDLVNKGDVFDALWTHPKLLAAVRHVLGRPFKLSSLNSRDAAAGQGHQPLHADWGANTGDGRYHVVNSLWLLDDYTGMNGCTRIVPGTHRRPGLPADHMDDPKQDHAGQVVLTAPAGTAVVFNAHTWHGGTTNRSGEPRRVCHCYFTGREHEQQLDQARHIRGETLARLSPAARWVLEV